MNPIYAQNNIFQMVNLIRTGQVDAKTEVMRRLQTMTPQQKNNLRYWMPTLQKIAQQNGLAQNDLDDVIAQLK